MAVPIVVEFLAGTAGLSAGLGKVTKELGALKLSSEASMANVGKVGVAVSGLMVVAAGAVAVASIKMAADFQSSMLLIQTNAGASADEVKKMSAAVLDLAGPTATAPEQLATSLYHIESVGLRGAQALDVLKIAAEGAHVGNADLEQTTNALTATVASGIPGIDNMGQAMGKLINIVGAGDMKMEDLNQALGTGVLTVVKGYGLSLDDVGAALATFGDNNIRGADAATMLRMAVQAMAVPVKGGEKQLKALGISAGQLGKDMQEGGINKALVDLQDHLKSSGVQANQVGEVLTAAFGKKAGPGLAVLEGQMTRFETKLTGLKGSGDHFAEDWQAWLGTVSAKWDTMKASLEAVAIKLGTVLLPAVAKAADGFMVFLGFIADHQWALAALAAVIGGALIVALSALAVALWGIASNPVVLIVAAIIAAVALLGVGIYELATHWSTVWGGIKTVTATVATFFVDRWNLAWSQVQGVLSAISGFFSTVWNAVSSVTMTVIGAITGFISDAWNSVWSTTQAVWGAISGFFSTWWPLLLAVFAAPIFALLVMWHAFHDEVWALVQGVWSRISGYLSGVWSVITAAASAAWSAFESDVVGPVQSAAATISGVWSGVVSFLSGVWSSITSGVSSAWDTVVSVVSSAVAAVLSAVTSVGGSILHAIEQPFIDAYNFISGLVGQFFSVGENIVQGIISGVESAAGGLLSSLSSLAGDALSAAKSAIGIKSPSTAFADQVGGPISQGIAVGVTAAAPLVNAAVTDALRASLALAQQQAASMFGGSEKLQYTDTAGLSAAKKQALIDANNAADQAEQVRLSNVVRNVPTTTGPFAARNAADLAEQVRLFNQEQARSARIAYAALTPSQQAAASLAANTAAVVAEEVRLANELALRNNPTPVARTSYSPPAGGISSAPPVTPKPVEVLITINGGVYGGPSGIQELASLIRTELLKAKAYTGPLGLA
jgi:TP901 family phage tail tape measure protein